MSKNMLVEVKEGLEKQLMAKMEALPENFNKTRFVQNALTVLNDNKNLQNCTPQSVVIAVLKGAFLGLDFFNKEAYIIAYGKEAQFQTDYKGEMKVAKKYSINPIKDIYAKLVRVGDDFQEKIEDGKQTISFNPAPFSDEDIVGAFAVVYYQDGSMMYETMSKKEIEHTRDKYSKYKNSKAWQDSWGEMAKKTVLRRLLKLVEVDFKNAEQDKSFAEGGDLEFDKEEVKETKKTAFEETFEEAEVVETIDKETGVVEETKVTELPNSDTLFGDDK